MTTRCGCCEGIEVTTPVSTENRPGLRAITFRVGTHATFLETMLARLGTMTVPDELGSGVVPAPLAVLATRDPSDPTIALLDAWATVGDVLTFYQERIANEGYLRTATERRSVVELGRLVGYVPRPGVAASVYLAFTLEDGHDAVIPVGTRAQSVPQPGEEPQMFETSVRLEARSSFNELRPRMGRPQRLAIGMPERLHFRGAALNLEVNDVLLLKQPPEDNVARLTALQICDVNVDARADRTSVTVRRYEAPPAPGASVDPAEDAAPSCLATSSGVVASEDLEGATAFDRAVSRVFRPLDPSTVPPRDATALRRDIKTSFGAASGAAAELATVLYPALRGNLYAALRTEVVPSAEVDVHVMRVTAAAFGYNAPTPVQAPGVSLAIRRSRVSRAAGLAAGSEAGNDDLSRVYLDSVYDGILPGTHVIVAMPRTEGVAREPLICQIERIWSGPHTAYGMSAKATRLDLDKPWRASDSPEYVGATPPEAIRTVVIHAAPERLALTEEPIVDPVEGRIIPLDSLYDGLEAGRWMIISGERADVPGLRESELVMLAGVRQEPLQDDEQDIPGDTIHTTLVLANALANTYRRETVTIHGNVVHATHGETHREVLGSGDATKPFQTFALRQSPLTYVSAPTTTGAASTLAVRVDGILWPERSSHAFLEPHDRNVVVSRDEESDDEVVVMGGDGHHGARFPSGIENVTAVYRTGIGRAGNVGEGQIRQLATQPLGVRGVQNPIGSTGGADPDTRDQARENVPFTLRALDRIVSVRDYADFARTFAGIGKAEARRSVTDGHAVVTVVVAGAGDAPIDETSDVYRNLREAFSRYSTPQEPVELRVRIPVFLLLSARVRLAEGHEWSRVEPALRAALLDAFGFEKRRLGEAAALSVILRVMHGVPGVRFVDVDAFGGVRSKLDESGRLVLLTPEEVEHQVNELLEHAQKDGPLPRVTMEFFELGYFTSEIPATLILTEIQA